MIVSSAVKLNDGRVFVGKRHGDCYKQGKLILKENISLFKESIQGFITDNLIFLNRQEAYYEAYKNNQCEEQKPYEANYCEGLERSIHDWKPCLFSEDLW